MSASYPPDSAARGGLDRALGELRPRLQRYTARMTGSAVDGEDVVQDAIVKAIEAFPAAGAIANLEGWIFRILHTTAIDFLRRRGRLSALSADDDPDTVADPATDVGERQIALTSLRTFMQLPPAQRSSVILMDVLGYSLDEIAAITDLTVAAVKAALHRGRMRLRDLARRPEDHVQPALGEAECRRLAAYVDRFNARDFDALRDLLADDVRLDLVNKIRHDGRNNVSRYFENYAGQSDWRMAMGFADARPAILVFDPHRPDAPPAYFIALEWAGGRISRIRDFRYARDAAVEADLRGADGAGG